MKKLEDHTNLPNCGKLTLVLLILTLRRLKNVYLHSRSSKSVHNFCRALRKTFVQVKLNQYLLVNPNKLLKNRGHNRPRFRRIISISPNRIKTGQIKQFKGIDNFLIRANHLRIQPYAT